MRKVVLTYRTVVGLSLVSRNKNRIPTGYSTCVISPRRPHRRRNCSIGFLNRLHCFSIRNFHDLFDLRLLYFNIFMSFSLNFCHSRKFHSHSSSSKSSQLLKSNVLCPSNLSGDLINAPIFLDLINCFLCGIYATNYTSALSMVQSNGGIYSSRPHENMGLSSLNVHRFKYNFISNSRCLLCQHRSEDTTHFLLHCPALATPVSHF